MNYSQITDSLYVGRTPRPESYDELRALGVELVINMRVERRPFNDPGEIPMDVLWLPSFDSPLIPIPIRFLVRGAKAAVKTLEGGGKVYVHCAGGVHRGVAMGTAILIAQGYSAEEAMDLIQEKREVADPRIWYIRRRIEQFEETWNEMQGETQRAEAHSRGTEPA